MTAECNWCDQRFHLNQRNDIEGKDCGEVWIDEQYLALQFGCARCLAAGAASGASMTPSAAPVKADGVPSARRYKRRA
ncbi:MAG: hypothetical protein M3P30_13075 [Chloroflexota bacterium]|nr:hypothetical protein [Chloroflexota bacterium]